MRASILFSSFLGNLYSSVRSVACSTHVRRPYRRDVVVLTGRTASSASAVFTKFCKDEIGKIKRSSFLSLLVGGIFYHYVIAGLRLRQSIRPDTDVEYSLMIQCRSCYLIIRIECSDGVIFEVMCTVRNKQQQSFMLLPIWISSTDRRNGSFNFCARSCLDPRSLFNTDDRRCC